MSGRFVILEHVGHGEDHFDLMLAVGEVLATWQFDRWPDEGSVGRPLADHRVAYLTCEGPISGGRGEVRRIAEGTFDIVSESSDDWRVALDDGATVTTLSLPLS